MRTARTIALSREGWYCLGILAFVLVGALVRQINLLVVFFGLIAGPLVLNWRLVRLTLGKLEVRRRVPPAIQAGDPLIVTLTVANQRRHTPSWALLVTDSLMQLDAPQPKQPRQNVELHVAYLPPRQRQRVSYTAHLHQRGRYLFGPLSISTRFPFGLVRFAEAQAEMSEVLVLPRLGRLGRAWHRQLGTGQVGGSNTQQRRGSTDGDFYGLREWRASDSRSWIHWRSSARRQTLLVRQYEQPRKQDLALLLDLWQSDEPTLRQRENVELAVSFAATVITEACRHGGTQIFLATGTQTPLLRGTASGAFADEALRTLALAEPTTADQLPTLLGEVLPQLHPATKVVVLSTRSAEVAAMQRDATQRQHGALSTMLGRILTISTEDPRFADYFEADAAGGAF